METKNRRVFLRGLASLPVIAGGAALVSVDPIVQLRQEAAALKAYMNRPDVSTEAADIAYVRYAAIDFELFKTVPTSTAGSIAALEWAREEFVDFYSGADPARGDKVILSLIDGALGVLRSA